MRRTMRRIFIKNKGEGIGIGYYGRMSSPKNTDNPFIGRIRALEEALESFAGVRRRLEVRGTVRGVTVIDDFAHHPTAIRVTLDGLRQRVGAARILAVVEPRSNTMKLGTMKAQLPESLAAADAVFCYSHNLGWDAAAALAPLGARAATHDDLGALVAAIAAQARSGDQILVMSNGGFGGIHEKLLHALAA